MLRYLKVTLGMGLMYKKGGVLPVRGYNDASHARESDTRKGRGGYVFMSGGAAVRWRTNLLETVTYSTCESEYVALSNAGNEAMYLRQMQGERGNYGSGGVLLLEDNESSMKLAENQVFHRQSKNIEIKYHSIRNRVAKNQIRL